MLIADYSLISRPRPAFRRLQYGKLGGAWEQGYADYTPEIGDSLHQLSFNFPNENLFSQWW